MQVAELIGELLIEIGEPQLAKHVAKKLSSNEDARAWFKVATENGSSTISYLHLEYGGLIAELE
jgi:hypothetical protein